MMKNIIIAVESVSTTTGLRSSNHACRLGKPLGLGL